MTAPAGFPPCLPGGEIAACGVRLTAPIPYPGVERRRHGMVLKGDLPVPLAPPADPVAGSRSDCCLDGTMAVVGRDWIWISNTAPAEADHAKC